MSRDRPRWASLTPEQHAIAKDLTARAERLWHAADGEISLAEAVDLAAIQGGHATGMELPDRRRRE